MTREELKSHLEYDNEDESVYNKADADSVMDAMEQRIKELEASKPKWISVEEMLPKECEAVVCLVDKWEEMSVCWIEYMYEDKRWTDGDRDYPMDYYTHWMPLPSAPKSEKSTEVIKENLITEQTNKSED